MTILKRDGVEVCLSGLSYRTYKAAPASFMIPVRPDNRAAALAVFRDAGFAHYSGLRIIGLDDLGFLSDFPDLLYLEILGRERVNSRQLDGLSNLRGLYLESPGAGVDFACFPALEVYTGGWHERHFNIDTLQELRLLQIGSFRPKSKDLSALAGITRLDRLRIGRTDVTSLEGIETLEDLQILELFQASKLESLDALARGLPSLREIDLEKCKKIESYAPLARIERLRRLKMTTCAPMPHLRWTRGMDHLDFFSFVETKVEDGDLSPLLELPRLRYVGSENKRHYSHTCEELIARLEHGRGGAQS